MNPPSQHPLFVELKALNLPVNDFAVFGSAPMWIHGLKELNNDIDLVARGEAWEKAITLGSITTTPTASRVVRLLDGKIEIFDTWGPGEWDINQIIDNAEEIDGVKFVSLSDVARWKEIYGREKDLQHLALIKQYLERNRR